MKNKKELGQHWLKNRAILDEIADLTFDKNATFVAKLTGEEYKKAKLCVEIGPGLGTLTSSLLKRFDKVIAVEFDKRLAENLPKSFPGTNLKVVNADILKFDFSTISEKYVVAGNIPYYITNPIIVRLLTLENLPERIVLLIQKEVAERIVDDKETMLSLFVKNRARAWAGPVVKAKEFTPPPKVHSQVIILEPRKKPQVSNEVLKVIKIGFSAPRKKLVHNLAKIKPQKELVKILKENGIDENMRPGDLSLQDWQKLYQSLNRGR
jgi:16S rRNA (adenine1518-N6/adenine1519-N6)-dimethyltransferase